MIHRITDACTGFGGNNEILMDNEWTGEEEFDAMLEEMFAEAKDIWFMDYPGIDFGVIINSDGSVTVRFGIEPSYKFDRIKIISIDSSDIDNSTHTKGIAFGYYGTGHRKEVKLYSSYKKNCKFKRFVDKWAPEIKSKAILLTPTIW